MTETEFKMPPRPWSIYIVTLWSVARAATELLAAYGLFVLYRPLETVSHPISGWIPLAELSEIWSTLFSANTRLSVAVSGIEVFAFVVLAIGIFLGLNWGRVGFLGLSVAILFWNISIPVLQGGRLSVTAVIYSLIAIGLASWYFRRSNVVEYFGTTDTSPKWVKITIGRTPLDLGIALTLIALMVVVEISGLVRLLQTMTR